MKNSAEPFIPPCPEGFVMLPTDMCEYLSTFRIGGYERRIFDCILRKTVGWKKQWDYIPISQFSKACRIQPPNVCRSLNKLMAMRVILAEKGSRGGRKYSVNFKYKEWKEWSAEYYQK